MAGPDTRKDWRYWLYRAGVALFGAAPEGVLFAAAHVAGAIIPRVNRRRRAIVRRNLARVVEPRLLDRAVVAAFRSYSRYWIETLRIPKPGLDEIRRRTTVEGLEPIAKYLEAGRGVIFVTAHVGSWDTAGAWLASHGWRVVAIAEELEPAPLYELFVKLRRRVGVEIHPLGYAASAKAVLAALRSGAVVGLAVDRDISGTGVDVEFLGEVTKIPAGPAVLAMHTGAVIAAGALYQLPGRRYHGVVLDPIPVERSRTDDGSVLELTKRIAADLEILIRRDPGQWHMFQPNWPSDPGYQCTSRS